MSCEHCTDPDGMPCFPTYGLAPHTHTKTAHVFDTSPTPGFTPDEDDQTQGTWWCVHCGDGKPSNAEFRGERLRESISNDSLCRDNYGDIT